MTDKVTDNARPEMTLVFTEDEWNASIPKLTSEMTRHLSRYRTPIFRDNIDHGEGWGNGSFLELGSSKYILTNEHVATVRFLGQRLGFLLSDQEDLVLIQGNHVEQAWPWDLALLPVTNGAWAELEHTSMAIQIDQIALAHTPVPTEVFALSGFAGANTSFHFNTMFFRPTTSIAREAELPTDDRWDKRFHFGLDYRSDLATSIAGNDSLPNPPGLSGSTVWNTCFVEAKMRGIEWTPDMAKVTGVVWGWPSGDGCLVATRAEHIRSFLLEGGVA